MKYEDFIHLSVAGDGACFFHSLATILIMEESSGEVKRKGGSLSHVMATSYARNGNALARKLRRDCVNWLEKKLDYTIPQLGRTIRQEIQDEVDECLEDDDCRKYKTVGEYLTYMKKYKSYAGQIEIYAIAYYLGRSIRVFIKDQGKFKSTGLGFQIGLKSDIMDDIHIYHNMGENVSSNEHHFEPLYPKVKAKKEVKQKKEGIKPKDEVKHNPGNIRGTTKGKKSINKPNRKPTRKPTRKSTRKTARKSTRKSTRKSARKSTRKSKL